MTGMSQALGYDTVARLIGKDFSTAMELQNQVMPAATATRGQRDVDMDFGSNKQAAA